MNPAVKRIAVAALSLSAAGFAAWQHNEGFTATAVIPTKGDVPTIGHGSTHYEDGSPVKMGDTISRVRAARLAHNLMDQDAARFASTLPGVQLTQYEFDAYMDFVGQYGLGNWSASSMRRDLLATPPQYGAACKAMLRYRFAAGYDCSTVINGVPNGRCYGVWKRQLQRVAKCEGHAS